MKTFLIWLPFFGCLLSQTYSATTFESITRNGCADGTKGCLFFADTSNNNQCDPSKDCTSGITYKPRNDAIDFELFSKLRNPTDTKPQYVAVGFSTDSQMGNDAVTYCLYDPTTGKVTASLAYNPGKYNELIKDQSLIDKQLHDVSGSVVNGILMCRFSQTIKQPAGGGEAQRIFSLDRPYNLLLVTSGTKVTNGTTELAVHDLNPNSEFFPKIAPSTTVTNTSVAISAGDGKGSGGQEWRGKLFLSHGALMIFGWLLLVACAILYARYFKTMLPGKQLCSLDYWFHMHRGLNTIGLLCIITAFVCVFVAKDGVWTGVGRSNDWWPNVIHAILGLTASIGAFIQPIMAIFRCDKTAPTRPIFNWAHRFLGIGSWLCASAAIWMATEFWPSLKEDGKYGKAPKGLLIFYWVVLGLVIIGLEVWITISERLKSRTTTSSDVQLRTFNGKTIETTTTVTHPTKYGFIRSLLLLFFVLVAIAVTVALVCFIALP